MTPLPRRRFLQLLGGGTVAAAVPALGACSGLPEAATAAWGAPPEAEVRRFMLAHALLAPNPHNRQPWLADLRRPGEITLVCDAQRLLPATDPFGRQIVIGCGAFVELAVMAAAERGFRVDVLPYPGGEPAAGELPGGHAIARLVLHADASVPRDPLFAQVRHRHTHKGAYQADRTLPEADWSALQACAEARGLRSGRVVDAAGVARVRTIARRAYEIECTTDRTWLESAHLMRIGPAAIEQHRDGIAINGLLPRVMHTIGVFDPLEVPRPGTSAYKLVMDRWAPMETGSGFFWIASDGNGRRVQLEAGRAWVRAQLTATAAGIALHPLSQALQEFPEMRPLHVDSHRSLGLDPAHSNLQMLARVGYGATPATPSPRRDLARLVQAA